MESNGLSFYSTDSCKNLFDLVEYGFAQDINLLMNYYPLVKLDLLVVHKLMNSEFVQKMFRIYKHRV